MRHDAFDVDDILAIKKSTDLIISRMKAHIDNQYERDNKRDDKEFNYFLFLSDQPVTIVRQFVEFMYARLSADDAKEMVSWVHDETLDLTEIPVSAKDFKPWSTK